MAGYPADLFDLEEQGVAVAIDKDTAYPLHMPAGLAFDPDAPPASAPVRHAARLQGLFERLRVHVGDHEHSARMHILYYGRDQPPVVKAHSVEQRLHLLPPFSPQSSMAQKSGHRSHAQSSGEGEQASPDEVMPPEQVLHEQKDGQVHENPRRDPQEYAQHGFRQLAQA